MAVALLWQAFPAQHNTLLSAAFFFSSSYFFFFFFLGQRLKISSQYLFKHRLVLLYPVSICEGREMCLFFLFVWSHESNLATGLKDAVVVFFKGIVVFLWTEISLQRHRLFCSGLKEENHCNSAWWTLIFGLDVEGRERAAAEALLARGLSLPPPPGWGFSCPKPPSPLRWCSSYMQGPDAWGEGPRRCLKMFIRS